MPESNAIRCRCESTTAPAFIVRDKDGVVRSCWIKIDPATGLASPGCVPNEWTNDVIGRRNARRSVNAHSVDFNIGYPGETVMRCACGSLTRALTSSANEKPVVPVNDAPDPLFAFGPQTCWLAIADDDSPKAGCSPDHRTWEVLARAGKYKRNANAAELVTETAKAAISEQSRKAFDDLINPSVAEPARTKPAKAKKTGEVVSISEKRKTTATTKPVAAQEPEPELSLFG